MTAKKSDKQRRIEYIHYARLLFKYTKQELSRKLGISESIISSRINKLGIKSKDIENRGMKKSAKFCVVVKKSNKPHNQIWGPDGIKAGPGDTVVMRGSKQGWQ